MKKLKAKINFNKLFKLFIVCSLFGVVFITFKLINIYAEPKASLVVESGDVFYSLDNKYYVKVTEREIAVNSGIYIKTNNGKANVILPNNSVITVDENTTIQLTYNTSGINILQFLGNTWHRVKNLGGISYQVKTPNAIAAVRGTEFSVEVDKVAKEIHTKVIVTEHKVDLAQSSLPKTAIQITEGMFGEVSGDEMKLKAIPESVKETPWYKDNQKLTSILETVQQVGQPKSNTEIIKQVSEDLSSDTNVVPTITKTPVPQPILTPTPVPVVNIIIPTPTLVPPPPLPGEVYADQVISVSGTFGHCCGDLSNDPNIAQGMITGGPDGNFIQISDDSTMIIKFANNKVIEGPGADIRVFYYDDLFPGSAVFAVGAGPNCLATSYYTLGTFTDDRNVFLDIFTSGFTSVQCLKITDLVSAGDPYPQLGFDLDAVEAIHSEIVN